MSKKGKYHTMLLYGSLTSVALVLVFPFYWVISSSVKTHRCISMTPPAFYPCRLRTGDITKPAAGRVVTADQRRWFRLCGSGELADDGAEHSSPGGYYVCLEGDNPSQLVKWWPDSTVKSAENTPKSIEFKDVPANKLTDGRTVLVVARMVHTDGGLFEELLFVQEKQDQADGDFELLRNRSHQPVYDFHARWKNYVETLKGPEATYGGKSIGFIRYLRNSFFVSTMAVLGQLISSSLVAYGFARIQFKGRTFLFVLLLATLMIPAQVTLIPLFSIYKSLGWIDTFLPLIVPHFTAGAFNVFLLRQYMLTLPRELDESAAIDGCGAGRVYWHIILPNCVPVMIVVALFTFVFTWQNVMGPLIYLDNPAYRTVPLGLEYFRSPYVDNRHLLMTGATLAMLPVAILFIFLQRHIMSGIATTGLKG